MDFDKEFLGRLFEQAIESPRLRQSFDLRTSSSDSSQRILNALFPGTVVPIHRYLNTSETVVCLCGKMDEVIYEESVSNKEIPSFREVQRIRLCPTEARYGCQVPMGLGIRWKCLNLLSSLKLKMVLMLHLQARRFGVMNKKILRIHFTHENINR